MNNCRSISAFLTVASWAIVWVNCPLFNHSSLDRPNSVLLLGTDFPAWLVLVLESCCSYLFPDSHSVGSRGSLKSPMVGVFTPRKLATVPSRRCFILFCFLSPCGRTDLLAHRTELLSSLPGFTLPSSAGLMKGDGWEKRN